MLFCDHSNEFKKNSYRVIIISLCLVTIDKHLNNKVRKEGFCCGNPYSINKEEPLITPLGGRSDLKYDGVLLHGALLFHRLTLWREHGMNV